MKQLCYSITVTLFFNACSSTVNLPNEIVVNEITGNPSQKAYHNLLICGAGSLQAKLVYEKLYPYLSYDLGGKNISTEYVFLGSDTVDFNKLMQGDKYDAYMILREKFPADEYHINSGVGPGSRAIVNEFKEMLAINIYEGRDIHEPVWNANVKLHFLLNEDKIYPALCRLVIQRLEQNHILPIGN